MRLFCYGTLKSKYGNNRLLQDATFCGEAVTLKKYFLGNSGIPFAMTSAPNDGEMLPVMGEVWKINEEHLRRCDNLEGHPRFYTRNTIDVKFLDDHGSFDDEVVSSYIYEMLDNTYGGVTPSNIIRYNSNMYYCWDR